MGPVQQLKLDLIKFSLETWNYCLVMNVLSGWTDS